LSFQNKNGYSFCFLEHKDNYSVIVVIAYKLENGNIIRDDIFAMKSGTSGNNQ
jgi:hypothetical protein